MKIQKFEYLENRKSFLDEILGHSAIFWIEGQLPCLVLSVESLYVIAILSPWITHVG